MPVVSVNTGRHAGSSGLIKEYHLDSRPRLGRLESTRLHHTLDSLSLALTRSLSKRLAQIASEHNVEAVHSVAHGTDFMAAFELARSHGLPFVLTLHDHPDYAAGGGITSKLVLRKLAAPWRNAALRYVISDELADEMANRYGRRPYVVVTDGLSAVSPVLSRPVGRRHVYFMGSLHVSYRENLLALVKGLALYRDRQGGSVSLTVRGGGGPALEGTSTMGVPIYVLPWGSQADVELDMRAADLLYVPMPFGRQYESFVRYSLSTKLVTFMGSGLPILYHGPQEAVAARLLKRHRAAISAYSMDPATLAASLMFSDATGRGVTSAAGKLAAECFALDDQRERFWGGLREIVPDGVSLAGEALASNLTEGSK
jgi:hypothetical protein